MCKFAKPQILGLKLGRKVMLKVTGAQSGIYQGRTGFLEQKHFDEQCMHDTQKKSSSEKFSCFFSKIFLNCNSSDNLTHIFTQTGQFFVPKLGYFLSVFKTDRETSHYPPVQLRAKVNLFSEKRLIQHSLFLQCPNSAKTYFRL